MWADASRGWEKGEKEASECKKSSGGFTEYQRCDLSDILLLNNNSDVKPTGWHRTNIPNSIFSNLRHCRTCLLPAVSWMAKPGEQCKPQLKFFCYHDFLPPIMKLRCWNSSSASTETKFHLSCDVLFHDTGPTISVTLIRFLLTVHSQREFMPNLCLTSVGI